MILIPFYSAYYAMIRGEFLYIDQFPYRIFMVMRK